MKVPKQYKSSDRYNAGTDVIYDDDSKLQYPPFIYATAESGDNGADDGGDEEGEDTMLVTYDLDNGTIDKTFNELKTGVIAGKIPVISMSRNSDVFVYYLTKVEEVADDGFYVYFTNVYPDSSDNYYPTLDNLCFKSTTNDGVMLYVDGR